MIKQKLQLLWLDVKMLGPNAFVPVGVCVLFALLLAALSAGGKGITVAAELAEALFPPMGAWLPVFLLVPVIEGNQGTMFFSYPTKAFHYVIWRTLSFHIVYVLFVSGTLLACMLLLRAPLGVLVLQIALQSTFFCALGLASMVLSRNSGLSLTVVLVYALVCRLRVREIPGAVNIFLHPDAPRTMEYITSELLPKALHLSTPPFAAATLIFSHRHPC